MDSRPPAGDSVAQREGCAVSRVRTTLVPAGQHPGFPRSSEPRVAASMSIFGNRRHRGAGAGHQRQRPAGVLAARADLEALRLASPGAVTLQDPPIRAAGRGVGTASLQVRRRPARTLKRRGSLGVSFGSDPTPFGDTRSSGGYPPDVGRRAGFPHNRPRSADHARGHGWILWQWSSSAPTRTTIAPGPGDPARILQRSRAAMSTIGLADSSEPTSRQLRPYPCRRQSS